MTSSEPTEPIRPDDTPTMPQPAVPPVPPMTPPVAMPPPPPLPPKADHPYGPPAPPSMPTYPPKPPTPRPKDTMYNRMGGNDNLIGLLAVMFGVLGTVCCCCWCLDAAPILGGIPALALGVLHLQRVNQDKASMRWLGWLGITLGVIALLGALCNFTTHWNDHLHNQFVHNY